MRPLAANDKDFVSNSPIVQYGVFQFGEEIRFSCGSGFNFNFSDEFIPTNQLICDGIGNFKFNKATMRYIRSATFGYLSIPNSGNESESDTPFLAIGTCARAG